MALENSASGSAGSEAVRIARLNDRTPTILSQQTAHLLTLVGSICIDVAARTEISRSRAPRWLELNPTADWIRCCLERAWITAWIIIAGSVPGNIQSFSRCSCTRAADRAGVALLELNEVPLVLRLPLFRGNRGSREVPGAGRQTDDSRRESRCIRRPQAQTLTHQAGYSLFYRLTMGPENSWLREQQRDPRRAPLAPGAPAPGQAVPT